MTPDDWDGSTDLKSWPCPKCSKVYETQREASDCWFRHYDQQPPPPHDKETSGDHGAQ